MRGRAGGAYRPRYEHSAHRGGTQVPCRLPSRLSGDDRPGWRPRRGPGQLSPQRQRDHRDRRAEDEREPEVPQSGGGAPGGVRGWWTGARRAGPVPAGRGPGARVAGNGRGAARRAAAGFWRGPVQRRGHPDPSRAVRELACRPHSPVVAGAEGVRGRLSRSLAGTGLLGPVGRTRARRRRGMRLGSHWLLATMKIAVIGKGNIGGTLGTKWRAAGHDVVYGARGGSGDGPGGAPVRGIGDALEGADVVVLAVPGRVVPDVVNDHGAALAGKVVIDAVNRMGGGAEYDSRALIADAAPSARYVRAFNSLGWENFADPLPGANLFFAADPEARAGAEELITAVGLEPAFLGDADATAAVDGLLPLWFALAQQNGGNRKVALRVVS